MNIITGEKIQNLCDIYIGNIEDFEYNPIIKNQSYKHLILSNLLEKFNNPLYIFCYSHRLQELSYKINFFNNDFILVSHNSDIEIIPSDYIFTILNCEKLIKWYGQNICFQNTKLYFLPIGIANTMWPHGNLSLFYNNYFIDNITKIDNSIYFYFNKNTNIKREDCYNSLKDKLTWLNNIEPTENLIRLSKYQFCICPEGNGCDTHRLWECLYLRVVPIVIKSEFTNTLMRENIPLLVLESWDSLNIDNLIYNNYNFNDEKFLKILNFTNYFY